MSDTSDVIYSALNVSLFAFILQSGTDSDTQTSIDVKPEEFKAKYEQLLKAFDFIHEPFPELRKDFPNSTKYELLDVEKTGKQFFSFSSHEKNQNPDQPKPLYRLLLYPQKISDSYTLLINSFRPESPGFDGVNLTEIPKFNPNQCLTLADDQYFMGQTFLITAYLNIAKPDKSETLISYAEKLLKALFSNAYPDFYEVDKFLDTYILEFSKPRTDQTRVLVLFYFSDSTSKQLQKIYFDLPELFLYYHKITHIFQMSRLSYAELDNLIQSQIISKSELPEPLDLEILKKNLKELLKTAPQYAKQFRKLEYAENTVNIHRKNYQQALQRLQKAINDDIEFFNRFTERESQIFALQIQADLNYSKPGAQLLDQAIASIRGLVEIEQAESDRSLENTIQILGAGLGAGGIVASAISGHITTPLIPNFKHSLHPGVLTLILSVLAALLVGGCVGWVNGAIPQWWRNQGKSKN